MYVFELKILLAQISSLTPQERGNVFGFTYSPSPICLMESNIIILEKFTLLLIRQIRLYAMVLNIHILKKCMCEFRNFSYPKRLEMQNDASKMKKLPNVSKWSPFI